MVEDKILIPRVSILEAELIINNRLYEDDIISEMQYNEVCKIIYEKINQLKNQS